MRANSKKETEQTLQKAIDHITSFSTEWVFKLNKCKTWFSPQPENGKPTTKALIKWSSSSTARRSNGSAPTISRHKTRPETLIKRTSNTYITKNSQPRQSDPQSKRTKAKKPRLTENEINYIFLIELLLKILNQKQISLTITFSLRKICSHSINCYANIKAWKWLFTHFFG